MIMREKTALEKRGNGSLVFGMGLGRAFICDVHCGGGGRRMRRGVAISVSVSVLGFKMLVL